MKYFYVKILQNNKNKNYISKNEDMVELLNHLEKYEDINILNITEIPFLIGKISDLFQQKVDVLTLINFLKDFHLMLKSGISITEIIEDIKSEENNKSLLILLNDLDKSLMDGSNISDVFKKYKWIPKIVSQMIDMGEKTGNLTISFEKSINYLERNYYLKKNLIKAVTYPAITFLVVIMAFFYWILGVLPKLLEFFISMNLEVPWITQKMSDFGIWISSSFLIPLGFFSIIFAFIFLFIKRPKKLAKYIDIFILKIPLIGKITKYYNMGFISDFLSIYLTSGFGIYDTVKELKNSINNRSYKEAFNTIEKNIIEGENISTALKNQNYLFTTYFVRMIKSGEKTGEIDKQATIIAEKYYEDIEYIADNIQKILSPLIMLIVMVFIITIIFAFIAPIYDSFSSIR